jgi:predicted nucleic acid-binding Zn ribbon protein
MVCPANIALSTNDWNSRAVDLPKIVESGTGTFPGIPKALANAGEASCMTTSEKCKARGEKHRRALKTSRMLLQLVVFTLLMAVVAPTLFATVLWIPADFLTGRLLAKAGFIFADKNCEGVAL